jgi:hypothetical protein
MVKKLPSQKALNSLLSYDAETGLLTWKDRPDCKAFRSAGKPALNYVDDCGYKIVKLDGLGNVKAHRVIWKMVYGEDPELIDHINGQRSDNRIENLRSVSRDINARNLGLSKNNTSGANGVYWFPNYSKWMVSIRVNGRRKTLGYFADKQEAIAVREKADRDAGYSTWRNR